MLMKRIFHEVLNMMAHCVRNPGDYGKNKSRVSVLREMKIQSARDDYLRNNGGQETVRYKHITAFLELQKLEKRGDTGPEAKL